MLPSQAAHHPDEVNSGAVCPAGGVPAARSADRRGERGAVIVHVAVAMMGLLAFSALTIDLGTVWVTRSQAQNAVDAAALAGVISLAESPDPDIAIAAARAVGQKHTIWGEAVGADLTVAVGACPAGAPAITGECLNVAIQRGGGGAGSPLPVFFSRIFGAAPTIMRASASAKVMSGNTSGCVRPLAIMDAWQPAAGTWNFTDRFAPPDTYRAPSASDPGTGHTSALLGARLYLGRGEVRWPVPPAGYEYFNLDVPRAGAEGGDPNQRYLDNMASCNAMAVGIGERVPYWDAGHEETTTSAQALISSDSGAYWDGTAIRGSTFQVSPRILTIALVDPQEYVNQQTLPIGSRRYVIRNMIGFFLEQADYNAPGIDYGLVGVVVRTGGTFNSAADNVAPESSFLKSVALVR